MLTILSSIRSLLAIEMGDAMIIIIAVCAAIGALTGLIAVIIKQKQLKADAVNKRQYAQKTEAQNGDIEREQAYLEANEQGYIVMSRNVVYSAGLNGQLSAGQYVMESADSKDDKFNVRVNGLVSEYQSGDLLTLADGDTISPVSGSVIIKAFKE